MHSEEAKVYIALLIAAGILGFILILFILSTLTQQRKHQQLHKEKINAEIKTLENERRRVARDLHDEIAVILSVAQLELSTIEERDKNSTTFLLKARGHIDDALIKIREIAKDLMPITLERKGLLPALEEFFYTLNEADKLHIKYTIPSIELNLSKIMQIHVYRIVQEIIHNSFKHSEASQILFDFNQERACIKICIADNGKGFNQGKIIKEHTGSGLHNISSRVEMLNGDMYLETAEGKGVKYTIEIPL